LLRLVCQCRCFPWTCGLCVHPNRLCPVGRPKIVRPGFPSSAKTFHQTLLPALVKINHLRAGEGICRCARQEFRFFQVGKSKDTSSFNCGLTLVLIPTGFFFFFYFFFFFSNSEPAGVNPRVSSAARVMPSLANAAGLAIAESRATISHFPRRRNERLRRGHVRKKRFRRLNSKRGGRHRSEWPTV